MNAESAIDAKAGEPSDLGFSYRIRKNGSIDIFHRARLASTLRGDAADAFKRQAQDQGEAAAQQLMARITGNYKRGNEGLAAAHARNRR